MWRIARFRILGSFVVILLVVLPSAACGGNPPAAVAVNPTAAPATPPPTAVATAAPTAVPTPTPPARFTVVGVEVQSGWRPPTIDEANMQQPSLGGEIPAELQWFVSAARADVGSTGYPDAVVSMVTNQGLVTDENDFRAAVRLTLPDGTKVQARLSGFPTQLNPDGTFKSDYEYYAVPGSVDASYIWTPGIGTDARVELSLVKHTTDTGAALLYWSDAEQSWQPVQGHETNGNVVRVGDELFRYSPEDGSAVSLGGFEGMASFAVDAQTGAVMATSGDGAEYTWENGSWVQERSLASGLEAFANSGITGQLEMVYSVHPEIVINEEPAKNFYNYFIEVVTTSKGFEPYWQALGLHDQDSIMRYLEENRYRIPTQVGEEYWPTIRFGNDSYVVNGQATDWVRSDQQLAMVDLSKIGFILTNNDDLGVAGNSQQIDQLYGQGNIGYLGIGYGAALRYDSSGFPLVIVKEVEASLDVDVSLLGRVVDSLYLADLAMHKATLVRALSTSTPNQPEANNCMIPGLEQPVRRGACIPDTAEGVQNGGTEYHGANVHTLNRLGLTGLLSSQNQ
jgi:hypothetical protein